VLASLLVAIAAMTALGIHNAYAQDIFPGNMSRTVEQMEDTTGTCGDFMS
jgi:hypothetical protein